MKCDFWPVFRSWACQTARVMKKRRRISTRTRERTIKRVQRYIDIVKVCNE